jgi:carbamoyltransferase
MNILGISAFYHDSAACLVINGRVVSAAQEERFSRVKHDSDFPFHAAKYCLKSQNIQPADLDYVVFYDKPFLKFDRLLETYLAFAPRGFKSFSKSLPIWLKDKLFQKNQLVSSLVDTFGDNVDWYSKLLFSEHHLSHAASAFFPSPFERAAILTMDGVGEWATTSLALGSGNSIETLKQINFPHSLGLLYSAITYYTGFKVNSGEYKVMGLAPYGTPRYADLIKDNLIEIAGDGSYRLDMSYFDYCTGLEMTNEKFNKLFDGAPRCPESAITQREMDLAASIQSVTEEVVLRLARNIAEETGEKNLCLAGGVALNCVANGKLMESGYFENIWIQPAAGDAGGALGAALGAYYMHLKERRNLPSAAMSTSYFGPEYTDSQIKEVLDGVGAVYTPLDEETLLRRGAELIAEGAAIGWHQGRMEFGPRALGSRSILADPRSTSMQRQLNLKVKFRESFRPFAPSVLREKVGEWFEFDGDSPYMLMVASVKSDKRLVNADSDQRSVGLKEINTSRSRVPAITHVDYSARMQTVTEDNGKFFKLIKEFEKKTGCPMLINTSFNVRGEPIVESPMDAYKCFMGTDLDYLIIGNFLLDKRQQPASNRLEYLQSYALD